MSTLRSCSYVLLALVVAPSLSSPAPSVHRIDGIHRGSAFASFFVSSCQLDGRSRRPRTKANGAFARLDLGSWRTRCIGANGSSKRGFSFPDAPPRETNEARMLSAARGGADGGRSGEAESFDARGISLSLFLAYLTVMGAKCALPSTLAMLASPDSGLAHRHASLSRQDVISRLLAFSTLAIAAGKLVLGPVIDSLGGMLSLQIALSTLAACLGSIGLGPRTCPTLTALAAYWIVVDFAFSSCWAACVKTVRDHLPEGRWSREIGRLAAAARTGNAISFAFFAWLLQWASSGAAGVASSAGAKPQVDGSWRWVFRASSVAQLPPLALLSYFARKGTRSNNLTSEEKQFASASKSTLRDSLAILFRQSRTIEFWLHLVSRSIIMVLVSFLLFIPSYMAQCYEMSSASSARVGSAFALGCLLSVSTLAERTYPSAAANGAGDGYTAASSWRRAYSMLAFLGLATSILALQAAFLRNLIGLSPVLGTALMFLFGFSLAIPFYLPSSMFALKRGGKDGSATIADAFDVCGFGLLAAFNRSTAAQVLGAGGSGAAGSAGMLLDRKRAWLPVFSWMLGGSIVAMGSLFGAVRLEGET